MNRSIPSAQRLGRAAALAFLVTFVAAGLPAQAQRRPAPPPPTGQKGALIDVTGYWVAIVDQDWHWRMLTPAVGDVSSIPVNAAARRAAMAWDYQKQIASGQQCAAYGAAGIMRIPERLHIYWADPMTLEIDTDAGMQKRMLHFQPPGAPPSAAAHEEPASLQGSSEAIWYKQLQRAGFGPPFGAGIPGKGGSLKVITTRMLPGYLRSNGIPYSASARMIEYFDRVEDDGASYLVLTSVVRDPTYLTEEYVTSYEYKLESDGSKWHPQPCQVRPPSSKTVPGNVYGP